MKAGVYIVVIIAILIGAGFYLFYDGAPENQEIIFTPQTESFIRIIEAKTVEKVGQPIEGFEPSMFMQAFPGILPVDFNSVETQQGVYQVSNGAIAFVLTDSGPEHSAARAITPRGVSILLQNISNRLGIASDTDEGIEAIFSEIEGMSDEKIKELIVGVWESTDDEKFIRTFEQNGVVIDTYEGEDLATSVGEWRILSDLAEEPPTIPLIEGATYLKIIFNEEVLYFTVSEIDEDALQLIFLDRGGALNFRRVIE